VRLPGRAPLRTRRLGAGPRLLAHAADRRRRALRHRGTPRRRYRAAVRDLGYQPGTGRTAGRPGARPGGLQRLRRRGGRAARPRLHGAQGRHRHARHRRGRGLPRLVHERPAGGPARRRGRPTRPEGGRRGTHARGARLRRGPRGGRGGGAGQGVHRGGRGVAVRRLLHVPRHEPGHAQARAALGVHVQPELRGPAGPRWPHPPGVPAGRRRDRGDRPTVSAQRPELRNQMDKFTVHTGTAVPLRRSNVDTDQIIPAEYLKRVTKTGFADGLFNAWRSDPSFVLNDEAYAGASVLVAGPEFGTGSSREHAVWALRDWGFRTVVAPRFGDIFRGNALKDGLLPVELDLAAVDTLWDAVEADPTTPVTVDLQAREVRAGGHT